MKNIPDLRLLKYAKHLSKIKRHREHGLFTTIIVCAYEEKIRIQCECACHDWSFQELCNAFPDFWEYGEYGEPVLKMAEVETNVAEAVCDWFSLDADEFMHLFDVSEYGKYQNTERFGGTKLTIDSDCSDLANNIIEFVKRRAECLIN